MRKSAEDAAINRAVNAKAAAVLQRQTADETVRLRKSNEEKLRAEAEMRAQATLKKMEDAQVSERAAENAFFASAQQSSEVFSPIAAAKMKLLGAEEKRVSVGSFYFPSLPPLSGTITSPPVPICRISLIRSWMLQPSL